MSNFITPNELLPIMDEVIILDARGFQDYKRGHIKGAFPVDIDKDLTGPLSVNMGDVIRCRIWSNWRKPSRHLVLMKILRSLSMILGFSWRVVSGGPCATWALKMYAFYLAVLKDG